MLKLVANEDCVCHGIGSGGCLIAFIFGNLKNVTLIQFSWKMLTVRIDKPTGEDYARQLYSLKASGISAHCLDNRRLPFQQELDTSACCDLELFFQ